MIDNAGALVSHGTGNQHVRLSLVLGFPSYHALTGNLPVLPSSSALHKPVAGDLQSEARSQFRHVTGNLPVLSTELQKREETDLFPGWICLGDPVTGKPFWWNILHRSRREQRPQPDDDGREGAGRGEPDAGAAARRNARLQSILQSRTWVQLFDVVNSHLYYWNRKTGVTQWQRPERFFDDGVPFKGRWVEVMDPRGGGIMYRDRHTGNLFADM